MKWLEIIEIRTVDSNYEVMKNELSSIIEKIKDETNQNIKLYINANLETDISIYIFHDTTEINKNGSELGLSLASNIKEFGMVNHYILKEVVSKNKEESNGEEN